MKNGPTPNILSLMTTRFLICWTFNMFAIQGLLTKHLSIKIQNSGTGSVVSSYKHTNPNNNSLLQLGSKTKQKQQHKIFSKSPEI